MCSIYVTEYWTRIRMHSTDKDYSHVEEKKQDTNEEKKVLKESNEAMTVKSRKMVINIGEGGVIKKEFGLGAGVSEGLAMSHSLTREVVIYSFVL